MLEEQKLENTYYDGRPVEKIGVVVEGEGENKKKHHQVVITFADSQKPGAEVMHKEEWDGLKTDGLKEHERSYLFQDATYGVQSRLMAELEKFNPRWSEIEAVLQRIRFANDEVMDAALHGIFGKPKEEASFTDLEAAIKAGGAEPEIGKVSVMVGDLYDFCKEKGWALADIQNGMAQFFDLMGSLKAQAVQSATGVPFSHLRLDHVIEQAQKAKGSLEATV